MRMSADIQQEVKEQIRCSGSSSCALCPGQILTDQTRSCVSPWIVMLEQVCSKERKAHHYSRQTRPSDNIQYDSDRQVSTYFWPDHVE